MSRERIERFKKSEPPEVRVVRIGEVSRKAIIFVGFSKERACLLIPENVEMEQEGEWVRIEGFLSIGPGKYKARDTETKEEVPIIFNPTTQSTLKQAA